MSPNTDLFAPPSHEELNRYQSDLFAPPTKEEMYKVQKPEDRGVQVYEKPIGPEQEGVVDRFVERVKDPQRWKAILTGEGPYANKQLVQGDVPLVMPGGAVPKLAKAATALAGGKGLGYALGRTALSTGQGAVMSAADGKEGESFQDKFNKVTSGAKLSGGIQLAAESLPYVGKLAKIGATKAASMLTGESEQVIKTYAGQTDDVNRVIRENGGETAPAFDRLRERLSKGLESAKSKLNQVIGTTLENNPGQAVHAIDDVVKELTAAKKGINADLFPEALEQIDDLIAKIQKVADKSGGKVNAKDLNDITQFLQDAGESAYNKGGQVFIRAKESAKAAKGAAAVSRQARNEASPDLEKAYAGLTKIRGAVKHANKNLLAPGRSDSALNAAGAGNNERNEKVLESLGQIAGVDAIGEARKIAAARAFASPSWFPTGTTGKTAGRLILGAGTGYAIDGEKGAAIGAGLTSPAMLKVGINASNIAKIAGGRLPNFGELVRRNPIAAQTVVQLVSGHIRRENAPAPEITPEVKEYFKTYPELLENVQDGKMRAELGQDSKVSAEAPKGPERWAYNGLDKLGLSGSPIADKLLNSKEGKQLLIEASDLKPGSPALKRIKERIEANYGNESGSRAPAKIPGRERQPSGRR